MVSNYYLQKLSSLYAADWDKEFAAFIERVVPQHPVCLSLQPVADRYENALDDVMVAFSVQSDGDLAKLHEVAMDTANEEMKSGRWNNLSDDETVAAGMVARQAYSDLSGCHRTVDGFMEVEMTLGVLTYAAVACNECFDEYSFRRIFLEAWFIYFGDVLSGTAGNIR